MQGNVILTDSKYEILTLLRSHRDDAKNLAIMARHPYPLQTVRLKTPTTLQILNDALASAPATSTVHRKSFCFTQDPDQSMCVRGIALLSTPASWSCQGPPLDHQSSFRSPLD